MKKKIQFLIILSFLFSPALSYCQEWIRTFSNPSLRVVVLQLQEHYDNGIIIGANHVYSGQYRKGWIIKTDVNGYILWEKYLGTATHKWSVHGISCCPDGGVIVAGACDSLDENWDPYVVKLNACGEAEWCHVFHTDNHFDEAFRIIALDDGTSMLVVRNWSNGPESSVWLFRLDVNGEILWEQRYFQNDSLLRPDYVQQIILDEGKFILTGDCWRPVIGQTNPYWLWPMLISTDSTGNADFEIGWGDTQPFPEMVTGEGYQSVKIGGSIYTAIRYYHYPQTHYTPAIIKTSSSGDPVSYYDLNPDTPFGGATTLTKFSDSLLIVGKWNNDSLRISKVDTLGNLLKEKALNNYDYMPIDAILTHDNKYLITSPNEVNNKLIFYLWKLNLDLEFDSIYNAPHVYDSLCADTIRSSTLFFPCNITVGVEEEPVKGKLVMKVYPNPAHGILHIELPQYLQKEQKSEYITVTTTFHKWYKDSELDVFDLTGKPVLHKVFKPKELTGEIDVSTWKHGIYYFRLSNSGEVISTQKVIVQ